MSILLGPILLQTVSTAILNSLALGAGLELTDFIVFKDVSRVFIQELITSKANWIFSQYEHGSFKWENELVILKSNWKKMINTSSLLP